MQLLSKFIKHVLKVSIMKILVIGANGTVGQTVVKELSLRHEIILVGKSKGDYLVDLANPASIADLYSKVGMVDAIVCAAGSGYFAAMEQLTPDNFKAGLDEKLLGQINLVLLGQKFLTDNGSFTLISGILSEEPILQGLNSSTINAAIEGFVVAAAIELPRGIRINVISPTMLTESIDSYGAFFRGFEPVDGYKVALAYSKSVEGANTGQIYKVR